MEEIKKKLVDIFKLEERVLYDAAGAADIVAAAEAEAQAQQEAADRAAEEARQAAEEAAKNAPPEDPAAKNEAEAGVAADIEAADNGIDADSLADGEFADVDDMGEADDIAADTAVDDLRGDDNNETLYAEAFTPEAEEVRELVVINSSVKDAQKIIDSLGENTDVLILEKGKDGLDQINDYLDEHSDVKYSALHIVSHGNAGYFTLCGEVIDGEAVANDPASWANIGEHLTEDGDIMLYACNLAGNEQGQLLVSQIASLTNADVAASVDTTGVRGNWDLEYSYGMVENGFVNANDYGYNLANIILTVNGQEDKDKGYYKEISAALEEIAKGEGDYTLHLVSGYNQNVEITTSNSFTVTGAVSISSLTVTGEAEVIFSGSEISLKGENYIVGQGANVTITGNVTWKSGKLTGVLAFLGDVHLQTTEIFSGNFKLDTDKLLTGGFNPTDPSSLKPHQVNLICLGGNSTLYLDEYVTDEQFASLAWDDLLTPQTDVGLIHNTGKVFVKVDNTHSFDALYDNQDQILDNYGNLSWSGATVTRDIKLSGINIGTEDITSSLTKLDTAVTISGDGSIEFINDIKVSDRITLETDWKLSNDITFEGEGLINGNGMLYLQGGKLLDADGADAPQYVQSNMGVVLGADDDFDKAVDAYGSYVKEFVINAGGTEIEVDGKFEKGDGSVSVVGNYDVNGWIISSDDNSSIKFTKDITVNVVGDFTLKLGSTFENKVVLDAVSGNFVMDGKCKFVANIEGTSDNQAGIVIKNGATATLGLYDGSFFGSIEVNNKAVAEITQCNNISGEYNPIGITIRNDIALTDTKSTKITLGDAVAVGGRIVYNSSDRASDFVQNENTGRDDYNYITFGDGATIKEGIEQTGGALVLKLGKNSLVQSAAKYSSEPSSFDLCGQGLLILNLENTSVLGETIVRGGGGTLKIAGSGTTFNRDVGITAGSGRIEITGDGLTFADDVTNAYGWYHSGHYYFDDVEYYKNGMGSNSITSQKTDGMSNYKGEIVINTDGDLNFAQVISVSVFTIEKARLITFTGNVGVAGGTFAIGADVNQVTFDQNLYVHAAFRGPNTEFTSKAQNVTIGGDVWNWVRIYRYHTDDKKLGLDFVKTDDGVMLQFNGYKSSTIEFAAGNVNVNGSLYNIGVFGNAIFNSVDSAEVHIGKDVYSFTCHTVDNIGGDKPYVVSNEYEAFLKNVFNKELAGGVSKPNAWKLLSGGLSASLVPVNYMTFASGNTIGGNVENIGSSNFYITGNSNVISGTFINAIGGSLEVQGSENRFGFIHNTQSFYGYKYDDSCDSVVFIHGENVLGGILNEEKLTISDPMASKLTLINRTDRGVVNITGKGVNTDTHDGFQFVEGDVFDTKSKETLSSSGLQIEAGSVAISSSFRVDRADGSGLYDGKEIAVDVIIGMKASLTVTGRNDFIGDIKVLDGGAVNLNATGITAENVTVQKGGSLLISELVSFSGNFVNDGEVTVSSKDIAGTIVFNKFVNGSTAAATAVLSIGNKALFNDLVNQANSTVTVSGSGSCFKGFDNKGTVSLKSDASVYNLTNTGTFTVDANVRNGKFVTFYDKVSNTNKLNLNGDVKFACYMEKNDAEGNITEVSDPEKIIEELVTKYKEVNEEALVEQPMDDDGIKDLILSEIAKSGNYKLGNYVVKDALLENTGEVVFGGISTITLREVDNKGTINLKNSSSKLVFGKDFSGESGSITGVGQLEFQGAVQYDGTVSTTGNILFNAKYKGAEQRFFPTGKNAQGELEYIYSQQIILMGLGEVHINNAIQFNGGLNFKRGTLVIDSGATLATSTYTEDSTEDASKRTIRVEENATFLIVAKEGQDSATLKSNLDNEGMVKSEQDLILEGTTDGDGYLWLAENKSVTYSATLGDAQTLYRFAEDSSTKLIISGIEKQINADMNITELTNNGADIRVVKDGDLTLGIVKGSAEDYKINVDKGGKLTFNAAAEINGSITNNGELAATAADAVSITFNKAIDNNGTFTAEAEDTGSITFNKIITNNGSFTAEGDITAGNLTSGAAENGDVNSEVSTDITGGKWNNIILRGGNTAIGGNAEVTSLYMNYGAVAELTDEASVSDLISIDTVKASLTVGSSFELGTLKVGNSKVTLNGDMAIDTLTVGKNGRVVLNGATEVTDEITVKGTLTVASAEADLTADSADYSAGKLVFSMGDEYTFAYAGNIGSLEVINGTELTFNTDAFVEITKSLTVGDDNVGSTLIFASETGSVAVTGKTVVKAGSELRSNVSGTVDEVYETANNGLQLLGKVQNDGRLLVSGEGKLLVISVDALTNNGEIKTEKDGNLVFDGSEGKNIAGKVIVDNGNIYNFCNAVIADLARWITINTDTTIDGAWLLAEGLDAEDLAQITFRVIGSSADNMTTLTVKHERANIASYILQEYANLVFAADVGEFGYVGNIETSGTITSNSASTNLIVKAGVTGLVFADVAVGNMSNSGEVEIGKLAVSGQLKNNGNAASLKTNTLIVSNKTSATATYDANAGKQTFANGYSAEMVDGEWVVKDAGDNTIEAKVAVDEETNKITITYDKYGDVESGVENTGILLSDSAAIDGDLYTNSIFASADAKVNGNVSNDDGGLVGNISVEGDFNNTGDALLNEVSVSGTLTNGQRTATAEYDANADKQTFANGYSAEMVDGEWVVKDDFDNIIDAQVTIEENKISITYDAILIIAVGEATVGELNNLGYVELINEAVLTGDVTNSGYLNVHNSTLIGDITNKVEGTVVLSGEENKLGDVANSGSITVENGTTQMGAYSDGTTGSLSVENGAVLNAASLSVNGEATFEGTVTAESITSTTGTVEYAGGDQDIIEGTYNNITLSGSGTKTAEGDYIVSGDAVVEDSAALNASEASFTYNGGTEGDRQQVISGTYENLTLVGGPKEMADGGNYTVTDTITITGTDLAPAGDGEWSLTAGNIDISNSTVKNVNSTNPFNLPPGNTLIGGSGWAVYDPYGAINHEGIDNKNFSALASQLGEQLRGEELTVLYEDGDILFRSNRVRSTGSVDELRNAIEDFGHEVDIEHFGVGLHGFGLDEEFDELDVADALASEMDAALKEIVEHE